MGKFELVPDLTVGGLRKSTWVRGDPRVLFFREVLQVAEILQPTTYRFVYSQVVRVDKFCLHSVNDGQRTVFFEQLFPRSTKTELFQGGNDGCFQADCDPDTQIPCWTEDIP